MTTAMHQITFSPENESKAREWLASRGGIAVWVNADLSSSDVGSQTYTPALTLEGAPMGSPHWRFTGKPAFVVTDPALVSIETRKEVARIKIRKGAPCYGGVNRLDRPKLDHAMQAEGANWIADYSGMKHGSAWFVAVVSVPDSVRPLSL